MAHLQGHLLSAGAYSLSGTVLGISDESGGAEGKGESMTPGLCNTALLGQRGHEN